MAQQAQASQPALARAVQSVEIVRRALDPVVVPARQVFADPVDLLGVQQFAWDQDLLGRILPRLNPGWGAGSYANEILDLARGAADRLGIGDGARQVADLLLRYVPEAVKSAANVVVAAVTAVLKFAPLIGSLVGLLFDWISGLFRGGPTQEEWSAYRDTFLRLREEILGFEMYISEVIKREAAFQKILDPAFALPPGASWTQLEFEHLTTRPKPYPPGSQENLRLFAYEFAGYFCATPALDAPMPAAPTPLGYTMVFVYPPARHGALIKSATFDELSKRALIYPMNDVSIFSGFTKWFEVWRSEIRRAALKSVKRVFPENVDSGLWNLLQSDVNRLRAWREPMGQWRAAVEDSVKNSARDAQYRIDRGLTAALNMLDGADVLFVHDPANEYRARDGRAPYPGRAARVVPRAAAARPENLAAPQWTPTGFRLIRGRAADNIVRGANDAVSQAAKKRGDGRGGAALFALAAAGALYAVTRD